VVEVAVNGQALIQTRDWSISGAVITFTPALTADDIHVEYMAAPFNVANANAHYETTLGVGQSVVTLPTAAQQIPLVTRSGVVQYQSAGHYTLTGGTTLTFADPILASEDGHISVDYVAGGGGTDAATVGGFAPTQTAPFANKVVVAGSDGKLSAGAVPAIANLLTNGGFEIWQRGNGPFTAQSAFFADRWNIGWGSGSSGSISRDTANRDGSSTACATVTYTHAAETYLQQTPEIGIGGLSGKTISFSLRAKTTTANAVKLRLIDADGVASTDSAYHSGSGAYETLTVSRAVTNSPSQAFVWCRVIFSVSCTAYLDNAMLVVGSTPADYQPLHPADDLARCLRYYERLDAVAGQGMLPGQAYGAGASVHMWPYKTQKAVIPTVTATAVTTFAVWNAAATGITLSTIANSDISVSRAVLTTSVASGLVAGNAATLIANGSGGGASLFAEANP